MSHTGDVSRSVAVAIVAFVGAASSGMFAQQGVPFKSTMNNPYQMVENWPTLGSIKPGAAIGIVPDGTGGGLAEP